MRLSNSRTWGRSCLPPTTLTLQLIADSAPPWLPVIHPGDIARDITPGENPPKIPPVGRLGSRPRLVGQMWSGVSLRLTASFQIFAFKVMIHAAGVITFVRFSR